MAAEYRPALPFSVPLKLLIPTYTKKQGVSVKTLPAVSDGILFLAHSKLMAALKRQATVF